MATAARLAFAARRNELRTWTMRFGGVDWSASNFAMQVRQRADTPGVPNLALATVSTASAEGLKVVGVTTENGLPVTTVTGRINKTTMGDTPIVFPYMGEVGDDAPYAFAIQVDGITRVLGDFWVLATAFGSDNAPTSRPMNYGYSHQSAPAPFAAASLTFSGDDVISVTIDGSELLAPLLTAASASAALAGSNAALAGSNADLARRYAISDTDTAIAGALFATDRGAKFWADRAAATLASFPNYFKGDKGDKGSAGYPSGPFASLAAQNVPDGTHMVISDEGWRYTENAALVAPAQLLGSPTALGSAPWAMTTAYGAVTANGAYFTITDTSATQYGVHSQNYATSSRMQTVRWTIRKDATPYTTRAPYLGINAKNNGVSVTVAIYFDTQSGAFSVRTGTGLKAPDNAPRVTTDANGDWSVELDATFTGATSAVIYTYPAASNTLNSVSTAVTGSVDFRSIQVFDGTTLRDANPRIGFVSANGKPEMLAETIFTPEMFDAKGDGTTNDTTAFQQLAAWINLIGGGTIHGTPGKTYIFGRQALAGATGKGGSWITEQGLFFQNCTKPVVIDLKGAKIKFADGMRFGSFDPVTGAAYPSTPPFSDPSYVAHIGYLVRALNCVSVTVTNGELDGNAANAIVGGIWGDTGYQAIAYGLHLFGNDRVDCSNLYIHDSPLDGIGVGWSGMSITTSPKPHHFSKIKIKNCGRNCFSITGSNEVTIDACTFERAGEALNAGAPAGVISSNPRADIDFEAEGGAINVNTTVSNSKLIVGAYSATAIVADSGTSSDITVINTQIVGNIYANKPRMRFGKCTINGIFGVAYGMTSGRLAAGGQYSDCTQIDGCLVSDVPLLTAPQLAGSIIDCIGGGAGVRITNTDWICTKTGFIIASAIVSGGTYTMARGTDTVADQSFVARFDSAKIRDFTVYEAIPAGFMPATGFYILGTGGNGGSGATTNADMLGVTLVSPNNKLFWISATAGYIGVAASCNQTVLSLSLAKRLGDQSGRNGTVKLSASNGPPTTGTWVQGAFLFNDSPVPNDVLGWVCTVGGTPGTWVAVRAIQRQAFVTAPANSAAAPTMAEFNALVSVVAGLRTQSINAGLLPAS